VKLFKAGAAIDVWIIQDFKRGQQFKS